VNKLLILLIFFTSIVAAENVEPDFEITNVLSTISFFDTVTEMREHLIDIYKDDDEVPADYFDYLLGYSECEWHVEKNMAHCHLYVIRPQRVDDNETCTIGHEVLHGAWGYYHGDEYEYEGGGCK